MDRTLFGGAKSTDAGLNAVAERAFDVMRSLGATLVDPIEPPDTKSISEAELTVLLTEFRGDIAAYLAGLRRPSPGTRPVAASAADFFPMTRHRTLRPPFI